MFGFVIDDSTDLIGLYFAFAAIERTVQAAATLAPRACTSGG